MALPAGSLRAVRIAAVSAIAASVLLAGCGLLSSDDFSEVRFSVEGTADSPAIMCAISPDVFVLEEDVSLPWEYTCHLRSGYVACQAMLLKPGDITLTLEVNGTAIRSARNGSSHIVFVSYEFP